MVEFIEGHIYKNPRISGKHIHELLSANENFTPKELPSLRTVVRYLEDWRDENKELYVHLNNPDKHKSKFQPAFGSLSDEVDRLNQVWELDSTPADILLADGRYTVVGCVDVYSRRAALLVSRTSKATAIAALLRHCILNWGVPEKIKTDNGKDYTSFHIARVVDDLGIKQDLCQPFKPEQKGHIERFFKTFSHDLLQFLPGFTGHNVGERQDLRARESFAERLMSGKDSEPVALRLNESEFQTFCNRWLDSYHHNVHTGEGMGISPFEKVQNAHQIIRNINSERALDILLAVPPQNRYPTVTKKGIRVDGQTFIAPELAEWMGQKVEVREDPCDYGKLFVFSAEGKFIAIAESNLSGCDRQKVAIEAKRRNKAKIAQQRKDLKQSAKSIDTNDVAAKILTQREKKAENLLAFPKAKEEHGSDGLTEAQKAVQAAEESNTLTQPPAPQPKTEVPEILIRDNPYYYTLWRELKAGKHPPVEELKRMQQWLRTPEGKALLPRLELTQSEAQAVLEEAIGEARAS